MTHAEAVLDDSSRCDPRFPEAAASFDFQQLEAHGGSVVGMWPNLRLAYFNPAWLRFAADNDGQPDISERFGLGACILDAVTGPLRGYYAAKYRDCLAERQPWGHRYECSSAARHRLFHLTAYPLDRAAGLLVVHSLVVEAPHAAADRPCHAADGRSYRDADGIVRQCSHCRCVQRAGAAETWDWVPDWVTRCPPETSHTICPVCLDYYYPDLDAVVPSAETSPACGAAVGRAADGPSADPSMASPSRP